MGKAMAHPAPKRSSGRIFLSVRSFVGKNPVLCIAMAAALITSLIVPPDAAYLDYFDFRTLTCLFCTLACIMALRNIRFFVTIAHKIVKTAGNARFCVLLLVYITFIGSMFLANDMALLTFLPLGYLVLKSADKEKYMAFTFIMQNIAANLGGMLTPFGNPQNLYLYTKFSIPTGEFMGIMAFPFVLSVAIITACCFIFVKGDPITLHEPETKTDPRRAGIYLILFALSIAIVFRAIPYVIGLVLVPAVVLFMDRDALKKVDYPLLLTFCMFFIFAGNMARIPQIRALFEELLSKNTLLVSALSCQVISNVPTAVLLSQFTANYQELLLGVNIGGVGTLISSLASLITFREYTKHYPDKTGRYIGLFSAFNFGMLAVLLGAESLYLWWIG